MKKCKVCNTIIDNNKLYCSNKCKEKSRYANKTYLKRCEICGKEFIGKKGKSKCSSECSLKSERKYVKTCPMCKKEFNSRGNGIYCSKLCYRTANNPTKGLMITSCEVCGSGFKTPKHVPSLVCSDICSSKLFNTCIHKSYEKIFGTTNIRTIKNLLKTRRDENEKK